MKKLLLIIAALFISFNTFAQEVIIDGIKYFLYNNEAYVMSHEKDFNPETLIIPEAIENGNTTYTVVSIMASAFVCSNLTTVEIPSGVIEIGNNAFYNSTNLVEVKCLSTEPPTISKLPLHSVFYNRSDLKIHVPEGRVSAYKKEWSAYANYIQGEDPEAPIVFSHNGPVSDYRNWSGLPEDVNSELEVVSALADKDVIIEAAATIEKTDIIKVNSFKIEGNGSITIEDGSQLIVQKESTGEVTMEKNINEYSANNNIISKGWYSICSPFDTISSHNLMPNDDHEFFRYDEPKHMWMNYKASEFDIKLGEGYIYAQEDEEIYKIEITGTPNIADKEITLTAQSNDENLKGFNLIGNPFMHEITQQNVGGKNGEDLTNILSGGFYKLSNNGAWTACTDGEIKPLEGFLVRTLEDKYTIKISHSHVSSSKRSNNGSITVNVSSKEYSDVAHISFNEGIGLNKIEHRNEEIHKVYIPVDGTDYAVAFMDENVEEIPVNFEAKKMGEYTISVSTNGRKYNRLTLLDKENNKEINMLAGSYTFLATTTDDPARFILKASLNNNQEAAFYTENNSIIIDNMKGAATVHVYDVMGRPVMKYNTNDSNCQLSTSSLANGVYIIQLMDENGTQVQKVIVNN